MKDRVLRARVVERDIGKPSASVWPLTLKNLFLPIFCKQCGVRLLTDENGFFCPTCWELSPRIERPFCTVCGLPHTGSVGFGTRANFPCAACREKSSPAYRRVYGAALYQDAVAEAIKLFKFHDKPRLAKPLGAVMADFAEKELALDAYAYVIPVPLHKVRLRDRGFNQSLLLAREVLPVFEGAQVDVSLKRIRPTRVQSKLTSDTDRRENIRGAFAVIGGDYLKGTSVLLVDDVVTTSSTVGECAATLRRAGVSAVDVLAAALAR